MEKAKQIAPVLEKDSCDVIIGRLAEYYSTSVDDKTAFYKNAIHRSNPFMRSQVVRNFSKYLNSSSNTAIISNGIEILWEQAKKPSSKNRRLFYTKTLKEIEASIKTKINDTETEIENIQDNTLKTEKLAQISELSSLRNSLHEKITSIDK